MRKRDIIEQNAELFSRIEALNRKISELQEELKVKDAEIEELKKAKEQEPVQDTENTPLENIKEKVLYSATFNAEEYGAKAIGKIVLAASKLTASENSDRVDLETVNRVLGRAEVAKAEILSVVSDNTDEMQKRLTIDSIVQKSCDYFNTAVKR